VGQWYSPQFKVDERGTIVVPRGPGWGITHLEDLLTKARKL
jgi:hypothetical protein